MYAQLIIQSIEILGFFADAERAAERWQKIADDYDQEVSHG